MAPSPSGRCWPTPRVIHSARSEANISVPGFSGVSICAICAILGTNFSDVSHAAVANSPPAWLNRAALTSFHPASRVFTIVPSQLPQIGCPGSAATRRGGRPSAFCPSASQKHRIASSSTRIPSIFSASSSALSKLPVLTPTSNTNSLSTSLSRCSDARSTPWALSPQYSHCQ